MKKILACGLAAMSLVAFGACGDDDDDKDPVDCFVEPAETCAGKCGSIVDECGITQDCGACESDAGTTDAGTADAGDIDAGPAGDCSTCTDTQYCGDDGACHNKVEEGDSCDSTMQEYCDGDTLVYCSGGKVDVIDCGEYDTVCRSLEGQNWVDCYDMEEDGCDNPGTSETYCAEDEDGYAYSIKETCSATHSGDSVLRTQKVECDEECDDDTALCDNAETCDTLGEAASVCGIYYYYGIFPMDASYSNVCTQWGNSQIWVMVDGELCVDTCGTDEEGLCDDPCKDVSCGEGSYCDSTVGDLCIPNGITLDDECDPDTFVGVCKNGVEFYCDESYASIGYDPFITYESCDAGCNAAGTACADPCDSVTCDAGYHCLSGDTDGYCFSDDFTAGDACDETTFGDADGVCSAKAEYNTAYYCDGYDEISVLVCSAEKPCAVVDAVVNCYEPCTAAEVGTSKVVCDSRYGADATVSLTCLKADDSDNYFWFDDYSSAAPCAIGCDAAGTACDDACDPTTDSVVHSCEIYFMWYLSTKVVCNSEGKWEDGGYDWCTDDGCNPDGSCIEIDDD